MTVEFTDKPKEDNFYVSPSQGYQLLAGSVLIDVSQEIALQTGAEPNP